MNEPDNQEKVVTSSSGSGADSGHSDISRSTWATLNRERGALINKDIAETLTAAERARLEMAQAYTDLYLEQLVRAGNAEAEVERLRIALASIADAEVTTGACAVPDCLICTWQRVARAALERKP